MRLNKKIHIPGSRLKKSGGFTLVELIVAMSVFSIIMLVMATFFGSAQDVWTMSSQRSMIYENAAIAMDMIQKDLESSLYTTNVTPFWHWAPDDGDSDNVPDYDNPPAAWGDHRFGGLAFISKTMLPANDECLYPSEVKYQLFYGSGSRGWLRRSVTGDKLSDASDDDKWGYAANFCVGFTSNTDVDDGTAGVTPPGPAPGDEYKDDNTADLTDGKVDAVFTAESDSSQDWRKVIPYVTKLTFTCYDSNNNLITPNYITGGNAGADAGTSTDFPTMVRVQLSLLDKQTWAKRTAMYEAMGNTDYLNNPFKEDAAAESGSLTPPELKVYNLRKANERTFTRIIFLNQ